MARRSCRAIAGRMKRALTLLVLTFAGCGHSLEYTALNKSPHGMSRRAPETVEVFLTQQPTRPAVEVGYFEIEQQTATSGGTTEMVAKLREEAAALGCDALVISEPHDRIQGYAAQHQGTVTTTGAAYGRYQGTSTGTVSAVRSHRAVCLVFTDEATASSSP